jgi:hypothetical protein
MALVSAPPDQSKVTKNDPFKFDEQVRKLAWGRQKGRCGFCGEDLIKIMKGAGFDENNDRVEAHHIVSRQVGKPRADVEKIVAFLKSEHNCMYLCGDCHLRNAHGHDFGEGGLRPPEGFKYSHGGEEGQSREDWIALAKSQWLQIFGDEAPSKAK